MADLCNEPAFILDRATPSWHSGYGFATIGLLSASMGLQGVMGEILGTGVRSFGRILWCNSKLMAICHKVHGNRGLDEYLGSACCPAIPEEVVAPKGRSPIGHPALRPRRLCLAAAIGQDRLTWHLGRSCRVRAIGSSLSCIRSILTYTRYVQHALPDDIRLAVGLPCGRRCRLPARVKGAKDAPYLRKRQPRNHGGYALILASIAVRQVLGNMSASTRGGTQHIVVSCVYEYDTIEVALKTIRRMAAVSRWS